MSPARLLSALGAATTATALALPAPAGPLKKAEEAMRVDIDGGRPLADVLTKAGWIATPGGSDRYELGSTRIG